jgi:hypothetical protein
VDFVGESPKGQNPTTARPTDMEVEIWDNSVSSVRGGA